MTKEKLLARKAMLKQNFDQTVANANALTGAMQEIDNWIAELEKAATPGPVAVPTPVGPSSEQSDPSSAPNE